MCKAAGAMLLIVLIAFAVSVYFYDQLPEEVATHWNEKGEVDGYMDKFWGTFLIPLMILGFTGLFFVLPKIDPLKRNYPAFKKYYWMIILFLLIFLTYVHFISLAFNLGYELDMMAAVMIPIGILFLFIGYVLPKTKRNWFMGIRTPWTLSSDNVWKKTHEAGGKLFMIFGAFFIVVTLLSPYIEFNMWFILGPIIVLVGGLFVYSYFLYAKEVKK